MSTAQSQFRAALLDPDAPIPDGLVDSKGAPTIKRFAVYRNNVTVALIEALRAAFPVLRKLLGDVNFDQLARLFARAHPPSSPLMMHYGADMPAFLESFAPLQHLGYLGDVARLELALRRAYHAADQTPIAAQLLADCPPEALMASTLTLAPAVQMIPSKWPLFDIWAYNTMPNAPKPSAAPQPVLITRAEYDPEPHALDAAQFAWLNACTQGATLSAAQDCATARDPHFDLAPLLGLLLQHGALVALTPPED